MTEIEAYDQAEREALKRLPNRAIIACSLPIFSSIGYPTRVSSIDELWRYADVMHEGRAEHAVKERLGGLTDKEYKLLTEVTIHGANVSAGLGKRIVPRDAPVMAVIAYRLIKLCVERGHAVEIGPGCGYLGMMLQADGFMYASTDVCQAFHLWQKYLWDAGVYRVWPVQMPWWFWINMDRADFTVDVITSNHVLNEMHEFALRYLIVRAEKMLGDTGVFVVESYGDQRIRTDAETQKMFTDRGWAILDNGQFMVPPGSLFDFEVIKLRALTVKQQITKTWDDVVAMWKSLGAEPSPDERFRKYCD